MEFVNNRYYKLNRQLLLLIGQWPYQSVRVKMISRLIITCLITSFITVGAVKIFTSVFNMGLVAGLLPFGSFVLMIYSKYFFSLMHESRIKRLLDDVKDDWNILRGKDEYEGMIESAEEGRKYVMRYMSYNGFVATFFTIVTASLPIANVIRPSNVSRTFRPPIGAVYMLNDQEYLVPVMLHLGTVCTVGLCISIATDSTAISLMHHVSGMFRVAGYQLEHVLDDLQREEIRGRIRRCLDSYTKAKKYTAVMNVCYQWIYFINTMLSITSMTFSLYYTMTYVTEWNEIVAAICFACTQIVYIFIMTYPMQKLKDQSSMMMERAYNARWYAAPPNAQKSLLLIMTICESPSFFVVGKVFSGTLESYTKIINATMSCVTVLCSIN